VGGVAGRLVAQQALVVEGDVALDGPALVLELRPRANLAAGEAEHSLGQLLAQRRPETVSFVVRDGEAFETTARQVVVVVRDAHRHPWMREVVERLGSDVIVVELGLPLWRPPAARGYAVTYGGSRVSYEVLADRLLEASEVPA
jgi:beta-N-acetylhexosaminidase